MDDFTSLSGVLDWQAAFCRKSGSPFSALVFEQIRDGLALGGAYAAAFAPWAGAEARAIFNDAAPLRLLAAFHYLVLSGRASGLARFYPPNRTPDADRLAAALLEAAEAHPEVLARFMTSPPQTNEVGRALCLVGGFLTIARETGLPLRCLELGASAGLNMNWDRFHYRFGDGKVWGDPAAKVQLDGVWDGGAPSLVPTRVAERRGCDQNPIDVRDPSEALRLQSYVWADQTLRLERLRAAIAVKQASGDVPEQADAADWAEAHAHPRPGVATVIYHSSFIFYPPKAVQDRIRSAIAAAGAAATAAAPVAWLSKEPNPEAPAGPDEVLLTLWKGGPDDGEVRRLALVHPHGTTVKWLV